MGSSFGRQRIMKKLFFILLLCAAIVLGLAIAGGVIVNVQDRQAMQAANDAYMNCVSENGETAEYMLYEYDGRFVALHNGTAIDVHDSKEIALQALFDDPDTTKNEADYVMLCMTDNTGLSCCYPFGDLTYVAFGDSITYGIDGMYQSGDAKYKMEKPYPTLVGETLGIKTVVNQGKSGATLCQSPPRVNMTEQILNYTGNADIISVMLGVNDFSAKCSLGDMTGRDNTTVYGSLHMISQHLKTRYPNAFIFYMTPFQYFKLYNGVYNLEDVANAIKSVAGEYNIPVLDMYTNGQFELEMNVGSSDGVHPSQQHHRYYTAPMICEFIKKHYQS